MIPLHDALRHVPDAALDVRYATARNLVGEPLYPFPAVFLLEPAARKLAAAAASLRSRGLRLVLYDGYRPLSVQRRLWAARPDPRFVADPAKGSQHNRGAAVDAGLCDAKGEPLAMPSEFDEFGPAARHAGGNSGILRAAMEGAGFKALEEEWWHYSDPSLRDAPLIDVPFDRIAR